MDTELSSSPPEVTHDTQGKRSQKPYMTDIIVTEAISSTELRHLRMLNCIVAHVCLVCNRF